MEKKSLKQFKSSEKQVEAFKLKVMEGFLKHGFEFGEKSWFKKLCPSKRIPGFQAAQVGEHLIDI